MVGRNGLFSGYKSQRTKGHKGTERGGGGPQERLDPRARKKRKKTKGRRQRE